MLKIISWLFLFIYNTAFAQVVLLNAASNDKEVTIRNLENLAQDLYKIRFPTSFDLNLSLVSIVIGFVIASILFLKKSYFISVSTPEDFLTRLINLAFIYSGTLFTIIYIFKIYYFPRPILILSTFIYPIITSILYYLIYSNLLSKLKLNKIVKVSLSVFIMFIGIYIFNTLSQEEESVSFGIPSTTTTVFTLGNISGDYNCYQWSGSSNFNQCIVGSEISNILKFDESISNLFVFDNYIFAVQKNGLIYKINESYEYVMFLDIRSKVGFDQATEQGLWSIAFDPNNEYFLVNYSNKNNAHIIEKYYLSNNKPIIDNTSEIILDIPNSVEGHFGGNIYYSKYFEDFIVAVGDMHIQSQTNNLNHQPIDTTSPKGKLLFLNLKISNPDLISENSEYPTLKNILATGLRNPWQITEYNDFLFVTDVGNFNFEELNIVNLNEFKENNNKPYLFGWPFYEGNKSTGVNFQEVVLWSEDRKSYSSIFEYVDNNNTPPKVFYDHNAPDVYRAAIIGGDILNNENSSFDFSYVFIDFMSKEVFVYDILNDNLTVYPLPEGYNSYPTSIRANPYKKNSLLISSSDGSIKIFNFS
jgi:hypothetical protein